MSFASKWNKGGSPFQFDLKHYKFKSLKECEIGEKYKIDGLYINKKSKYGDHPVAIIADEQLLIDLPAHMNETVKDVLIDHDSITMIKNGNVGIEVVEYEKDGRKFKNIEWIDL